MLTARAAEEVDLLLVPSTRAACLPWRNAQQAVIEVEALPFRGRRELVDADLPDYSGAFHTPKSRAAASAIVPPTGDRSGGSRAPERLDFPVDETPPR
jgi:hypothetical protein